MKHCVLRLTVIVLAMLAAIAPAAYAQGGGSTATLSGTVTDASGAIIPGATVAIKNNATATEYSAVSSENGTFSVPALNPGSYTVTVTLMGFKTAVLNNVRASAGVPSSVRAVMEVGGLEETVVVQAGSEIVQTQSAAVATTLDVNQISKLPTGSRSALTFVTSLPGVNSRTCAVFSGSCGLRMNAVSDRLNSRAIACSASVGRSSASSTTASGLPAYGVSVKTSTTW